jgi:serine/threonine protein kinase
MVSFPGHSPDHGSLVAVLGGHMSRTVLGPPREDPILRLSGGRRINLVGEIGRGESARVLAGVTEEWGQRAVAVKLFEPLPHEARERLTNAAEAAACVCNPHVAKIYDYDLWRETPYIVSELVDGCTLEALLFEYSRARIPFPHDTGVLIGMKVAEGLVAAFDTRNPARKTLDLVHGRLATRDVLVSWTGEVKVSDFGMGVAPIGASAEHALQVVSPRLASIAPELLHGWPPDSRSDIFSLGVILFEMLVGPRFQAGISTSDAMRWVAAGFVPPSLVELQLVGPLRKLFKRCTSPDPNKRYQHPGDVADALREIALLLGIPDVPAFIVQTVAHVSGVSAPEMRDYGLEAPAIELLSDSLVELVPEAD